jgi:hypothetical protein
MATQAAEAQRSVAEEALEAVAMAVPTIDDPPPGLRRALATLEELDDEQLRQEARRTLTPRDDRRLRALARCRPDGALTIAEEQELDWLPDRLEDVGLIRARAAALLKARGHDAA